MTLGISPLLLIAVGGGIGAVLRYLAGTAAARLFGAGFPWGTWGVNIIGGLLMGLLAGFLSRDMGDETMRLFIGVGMLGGFTTFSAFTLELFNMVVRGDALLAFAYAMSSVAGAFVALWCGVWIARSFA